MTTAEWKLPLQLSKSVQRDSGERRNSDSTKPANRQSKRSCFLRWNLRLLEKGLDYSQMTNLFATTAEAIAAIKANWPAGIHFANTVRSFDSWSSN